FCLVTALSDIYTLSLHDALPISAGQFHPAVTGDTATAHVSGHCLPADLLPALRSGQYPGTDGEFPALLLRGLHLARRESPSSLRHLQTLSVRADNRD